MRRPRRHPARAVLGTALLVLTMVLTFPAAELTDLTAGLRAAGTVAAAAATAGAGPLPWLHVEHPVGQRAFIADPEGRMVILRGVVSGGLVDYWSGADPADLRPGTLYPIDPAAYEGRCPANSATIWQPPLCRDDLTQMHALGFDVLRLALSWSLLEPTPGVYDRRYLDRIAQVVGWARQEGLYVILDMHENAYSRYLGRPLPPPLPGGVATGLNQLSGAPAWATFTDFWPSEVYLKTRELNPAAFAAFTSFWANRPVGRPDGEAPGPGLQEHYIGALAALARRFAGDSTVAGYGIFNEPWPGFLPPPAFEDLALFPFYRRVIDALSGAGDGLRCPAWATALPACGYRDLGIHDRSHLFFVEPDHLREDVDFATSLPLPFSSSPNLVYAIHAYTHVFTLDALLGQDPRHASYPPGGLATSYVSGDLEARTMRAALFVDEFGIDPSGDGLLAGQLRQQEQHLVGATVWPWKENCTLTTTWGLYDGVYDGQPDQRCAYDRPFAQRDGSAKPASGCLRADREQLLARVWPRALAGGSTGVAYAYNAETGGFELGARAPAGAPETLLYVPPEVTGMVAVSGTAVLSGTDLSTDGSRLVHVRPTGGSYRVTVDPAPLALRGCSTGPVAR